MTTTNYPRTIGLIAPKNGQGVTTLAASLALLLAEEEPTVLIGNPDTAAALGVSPGRDRQRIADNLELVMHVSPDDAFELDAETRIVLDGMVGSRTFMVLRHCYLALRRAVEYAVAPDGIITVQEPGRALKDDDMERVIKAPVIGSVPFDPVVARALDAGLLASRLPVVLRTGLRPVIAACNMSRAVIGESAR